MIYGIFPFRIYPNPIFNSTIVPLPNSIAPQSLHSRLSHEDAVIFFLEMNYVSPQSKEASPEKKLVHLLDPVSEEHLSVVTAIIRIAGLKPPKSV